MLDLVLIFISKVRKLKSLWLLPRITACKRFYTLHFLVRVYKGFMYSVLLLFSSFVTAVCGALLLRCRGINVDVILFKKPNTGPEAKNNFQHTKGLGVSRVAK